MNIQTLHILTENHLWFVIFTYSFHIKEQNAPVTTLERIVKTISSVTPDSGNGKRLTWKPCQTNIKLFLLRGFSVMCDFVYCIVDE